MGLCGGKQQSLETVGEKKNEMKDPKPPAMAPPSNAVDVKDDDDLFEQYQLTKGGSMFLPDKGDGMEIDESAYDDAIAEFLEEEGDDGLELEDMEDWENPAYSSTRHHYKPGDPIEYAPDMEDNVSFELKDQEGSKNCTLTFGYKTLAGKTGGGLYGKANQDSLCIVRTKDSPNQAIFSVFDGHGPNGEHASHYCRMNFMKAYVRQKAKTPKATPEKLMEKTLLKLDKGFGDVDPDATNVDPIVSGTTAVAIFFDGKNIISANVGDSRAILGQKGEDGKVEAIPLTDDHKPNRLSEITRIRKTSARVLTERELRGMPPKNDPEQKVYVCRQRRGEIIYAVLFSRSLGDVDAHRNLGVISDPEFDRAQIDESKQQCVILASDGIWDMMSNEECAEIVFSKNDPLKACEEIVNIAAVRWAESEERRRDDITVTIIGIGDTFVNAGGAGGSFA